MKKLLFVALALTACAPTPSASGPLATLSQRSGLLTFTAGTDVRAVAVFVYGPDLVMSDPACRRVRDGWGCHFGDLAKGQQGVAAFTGRVTSGNASFYTSGSTPKFVFLR